MMSERYENESLEHLVQRRLRYFKEHLTDTIAAYLDLELLSCDERRNEYVFRGTPAPWMINFHGTLHGGMGATFVDQAMGHMAFCLKPGPGIAPTVDMNVKYHRPLFAQDPVLLRVRLVSRTKSLMHLSCEASQAAAPEKVCISATATYYYKPDGKHL